MFSYQKLLQLINSLFPQRCMLCLETCLFSLGRPKAKNIPSFNITSYFECAGQLLPTLSMFF